MKIAKIKISNYRLLKDFDIDLEDDLSLVVGKNNCGKTSLLSVMDKFINSSSLHPFSFNDFTLGFIDELKEILEKETVEDYESKGITLKLFIDYDKTDNLSNISNLMMDLDPDNNKIELLFEYILLLNIRIILNNTSKHQNTKTLIYNY